MQRGALRLNKHHSLVQQIPLVRCSRVWQAWVMEVYLLEYICVGLDHFLKQAMALIRSTVTVN